MVVAKYCNLWRNYNDIQVIVTSCIIIWATLQANFSFPQDSWDSVVDIIDYYAANQEDLIKAAGPGHWNDPDEVDYCCPISTTIWIFVTQFMFVLQLIIGDFSLSFEQSKSQFAIWSIMASVWLNLAIIDDNFVFFSSALFFFFSL